MGLYRQWFGTCCEGLGSAMAMSNQWFRVEDNEVLYLTIAYQDTPQGPGRMELAVRHCPFCGSRRPIRKR